MEGGLGLGGWEFIEDDKEHAIMEPLCEWTQESSLCSNCGQLR